MKGKNSVIFRLSARNIMKNKRKYLAALCAVILAALLFSAVASLGYMLFGSIRETECRTRGDRSMAAFRFILPEQYEELKDDSELKSASYSEIVSAIERDEFMVEVRYGEDEFAENMYSYPTTGRMPEEKMEFAASVEGLKALGVDARLGKQVELSFPLGNGVYTNTFTLCGYWDAVSAHENQQCWLSKEWCNENIKTPTVPLRQQDEISYEGYYIMDIDLHNSRHIEEKLIALLQRHGYDPSSIVCQFNSAYSMQEEPLIFGAVAAALFFLMLVGYLLIYNIFHIRITVDTQYYALLSAVGMDERQLALTVRSEALFLTLVGAPVGILLGRIMAYFLLPFATQFLSGELFAEYHVSWWVYLLIFLFTGITVYLSVRKPAKIARQVTLVSGMDYQGNVRRHRSRGDGKRLSVRQLALWNILREKGKLWTVVVAVSFAVILFNSVYSLVDGFNMKKYLSNKIDMDYIITDAAILNMGMEKTLDGISPELCSVIERTEGLCDFRFTYMSEGMLVLDETKEAYLRQLCEENGVPEGVQNATMGTQIYGLNERDAADIDFTEGTWNEELFLSGKYAIVNSSLQQEKSFYHAGEEITVRYPGGKEDTYEVLAVGEVPYILSSRYWTDLGCRVILPESEYRKHVDNAGAMMLRCNCTEDMEVSLDETLREMITEAGLVCESRTEYEEEFADFKNAYLLIGGMLAGVIGLIGLLNFANTIITSVSYRERELTILNVIGMTEGQCSRMLLWEGFFYAALSILFTDTVGVLFSYGMVRFMASLYDFVDWNFSIRPMLAGNFMFLAVACIATLSAYWLMGKKELGLRLQRFHQ